MGAGIYTYRVEDGADHSPPFPCTIFVVTDPNERDLKEPWESCSKARAFCKMKNNQLKGELH